MQREREKEREKPSAPSTAINTVEAFTTVSYFLLDIFCCVTKLLLATALHYKEGGEVFLPSNSFLFAGYVLVHHFSPFSHLRSWSQKCLFLSYDKF